MIIDMKQKDCGMWVFSALIPYTVLVAILESAQPVNGGSQ